MTFTSDYHALAILRSKGMKITKGVISSDTLECWDDLSPDTQDAIHYLCDEWDYTYSE